MNSKILKTNARIVCGASVVGHKEREGPIGECFDVCDVTDRFNQKTWEKAEIEMQKKALSLALEKSKFKESDVDAMFAGDLLNQC
ncbi:MAG: stage V sporulation protein AD, partial [Clostridia bacterium]|nr:stage V sporulation protein AD [Clostridia bacterium]